MNNWKLLVDKLKVPVYLLAMSLSMSACATGGSGTSWKEEVQLHDGSKLIVDHHSNISSRPDQGLRLVDHTLTFTLPGSSEAIVWKTEYRQDVPDPNSLGALLLDVVGGVPYLATSPAGCIAYNKWGRPNPPYVLFKYTHAAWQQIPLTAFPPELVQANLMSPSATLSFKPYYTVEEARAYRQNGNVAAYARTILREAVGGVWSSCPEMVYYKGAWVGPGDSIGKRMLDMKSK